MKQQILIIHGATAYPTYESYIDDLKNKKLDLESIKYSLGWKNTIAADLGDEYEVLTPSMPNSSNAKYYEWKIWFERVVALLNDNVILVGHSMGGIFLAKYLSEETFPTKIKAVVLVAAPFEASVGDEDFADFALTQPLAKFDEQASKIILIQSEDDEVVPPANVGLYKKQLPNSKILMFEANGHFRQEHFPELVTLVRSL